MDGMAEQLRAVGIESPRREARLLLSHALGLPPDSIVVGGEPTHLAKDVADALLAALRRRVAREPLAYVLGHKEFWSLDFGVSPGVLVPRPESETLVEQALEIFHDPAAQRRVLDLGTGSGCLLLAFLSERPNAIGLGIDMSDDALRQARTNATRLRLAGRSTFRKNDWASGVDGVFDVIFVNPPYLTDAELTNAAPEVKAEPRLALSGGSDGLDAYRAIASQLQPRLKPRGRAFVEIGRGQADAVSRIFSTHGLETERTVPDLSGIPRCLVLAQRPA
jgi:release factor glutamine methyltransferase